MHDGVRVLVQREYMGSYLPVRRGPRHWTRAAETGQLRRAGGPRIEGLEGKISQLEAEHAGGQDGEGGLQGYRPRGHAGLQGAAAAAAFSGRPGKLRPAVGPELLPPGGPGFLHLDPRGAQEGPARCPCPFTTQTS